MRQIHLAGDKLFVDYAGDTVPVIVDRLTGEAKCPGDFVGIRIRTKNPGIAAGASLTIGRPRLPRRDP